MKKLFMGLALTALLAGCASHEKDNGMGGTSDQNQSMKTDSYSDTNSNSQINNNATQGTGSSTAPNNGSSQGTQQ